MLSWCGTPGRCRESGKGNHAGYKKHDDPRMKLFYNQLPDALRKVIDAPISVAESD